MKIIIGSDHAGFELKNKIIEELKKEGHETIDKGPFEYDENDDYPDFVRLVAEEVAKDPENTKGVVLGGSGQGEAIVCNRFKNIRAVVYYGGPMDVVKLAREHNNANILSLASRLLIDSEALFAVKLFMETTFPNEERHARRINKIDNT